MTRPNNPESIVPYVISADVSGLLNKWSVGNGVTLPSDSYFDDLTADLSGAINLATGAPVEVVSESEIQYGLDERMRKSKHPVISLDRAYIDGEHPNIGGFIDITRAVRPDFTKIDEELPRPRPGYPPLQQQIADLRATHDGPLTIVDDVIFFGDSMLDLIRVLRREGLSVDQVISGITIQNGKDKLNDAGIEVVSVREYPFISEDDKGDKICVIDEVCERDFVAGVPMSGRTVVEYDESDHWSAPYFEPFGDPEGWATIRNGNVRDFSRFCLQQSADLWTEIERLSGNKIPTHAIPRPLKFAQPNGSIATALKQVAQEY